MRISALKKSMRTKGFAELLEHRDIRSAIEAYEAGNFELSVELLEGIVGQFPKNTVINFQLGLAFTSLKQHEKAMYYLGKVLDRI